MVRIALSALEAFGCIAAVHLAEIGYGPLGFLLAFATVLLAWTEGHNGWGSS